MPLHSEKALTKPSCREFNYVIPITQYEHLDIKNFALGTNFRKQDKPNETTTWQTCDKNKGRNEPERKQKQTLQTMPSCFFALHCSSRAARVSQSSRANTPRQHTQASQTGVVYPPPNSPRVRKAAAKRETATIKASKADATRKATEKKRRDGTAGRHTTLDSHRLTNPLGRVRQHSVNPIRRSLKGTNNRFL